MLGDKLGGGRNAEVFEWSDNKVVKLFYPEIDFVDYEFKICQAVYAAGIPSPKPIERLSAKGRQGIIFEKVGGNSALQEFTNHPLRAGTLARRLGRLHAEFHAR